MSFKLWEPSGSCTFSKITQGRKWVGRVYPIGTGGYGAKLGQAEATGATRSEAFQRVVAKFYGYETPADLHAHNAQVRADNRAKRAQVQDWAGRFRSGDLKERLAVVDEIFDRLDKVTK